MHGQFFGSYLLNKKIITTEDLRIAITNMSHSHIKLGTLAMYKGYMTSEQVDECCYIQRREDKHFGEIALERNFISCDDLNALLSSQVPDYLRLGQALVDANIITNTQLNELLESYNAESPYGIYCALSMDTSEEEINNTLKESIKRFFNASSTIELSKHSLMYMHLLFNNLVRFIGDDFTPLPPIPYNEYNGEYCVTHGIMGSLNFLTGISMEKSAAIKFASRYAEMDFEEFDDYVAASLEDFINLHNGLFCVNLSNIYSLELTLDPPLNRDNVDLTDQAVIVPFVYPFGSIHIFLLNT